VIIGIVAFQGACREHETHLLKKGWSVRRILKGEDLEGTKGLIFPGGESTVMKRFFEEEGFQKAFRRWRDKGYPFWGICAGAVLLSRKVDGRINPYGVIDVSLERNAYGRHRESDSRKIAFNDGATVEGIFIRAPRITETGASVHIEARSEDDPVVLKDGKAWLTTWHPELRDGAGLYEKVFFQSHGDS